MRSALVPPQFHISMSGEISYMDDAAPAFAFGRPANKDGAVNCTSTGGGNRASAVGKVTADADHATARVAHRCFHGWAAGAQRPDRRDRRRASARAGPDHSAYARNLYGGPC